MVKAKKGATLIETVIALVILSLAVIVMTNITALKVNEQKDLDSQYVIVNVDALFSDMYRDFHNCTRFEVIESEEEDPNDRTYTISMDLPTGFVLYEYIPNATGTGGEIYVNGAKFLSCRGIQVIPTSNSLYVAVIVNNERRLDMQIYK